MNADKNKYKGGGQLVRFHGVVNSKPVFKKVESHDFANDLVAVFIHGFTADAKYLADLMQEFVAHNFIALAFDYPSYGGIDKAAHELDDLLSLLDKLCGKKIAERRNLVLVCHSMGGLVARAFVSMYGGSKFVHKVVTLGTPHDATLTNSAVITGLLAWGEKISGLTTGGYSKSSRSALQLMAMDKPEPLLEQLVTTAPHTPNVKFLSISGGMPWLEFGKNALYTRMLNSFIQWKLGGGANDGLVLEKSSDFSQPKFRICFPSCDPHIGTSNYARYPDTNHSYLINTQSLALTAIEFAKAGP